MLIDQTECQVRHSTLTQVQVEVNVVRKFSIMLSVDLYLKVYQNRRYGETRRTMLRFGRNKVFPKNAGIYNL